MENMIPGKKVLIVDGKTALLEMLNEQFQLLEEFIPSVANSGAEALMKSNKDRFEVIILDANLSDMDSSEVCRLMRSNDIRSPIIMLTESSNGENFLRPDVGANDYIIKPFRFIVLLAKMRDHIRQYEHSNYAILTIGPYSFQPGVHLLMKKNTKKKIHLTDKETAILHYLYRVGDKVVGRDVLLDEVWGYNSDVTTHTLETHIYRLRQKIEEDPSNTQILLTEPGGYRLAP
jgi:DNA-binding response OmpR family regulator